MNEIDQKLRIHPKYRLYPIERDGVAVLYNRNRPLILREEVIVSLVRCLLDEPQSAVDLVFALQDSYQPETIYRCLVWLLQQDILVRDYEAHR